MRSSIGCSTPRPSPRVVSNIKGQGGNTGLTAAQLAERLAGTSLPDDPLDVVLPEGSERWPPPFRKRLGGSLTPAGVLIPVIERADGLTVLLTQRAPDLKHHAGQISFPGGRMEEHDQDVRAAALRETWEEVGIAPEHIDVVGYLESMPVISGYAVTPVVGIVAGHVELTLDRTEVDYAFEVPLGWLFDSSNDRWVDREIEGRTFPMIEFHFAGERIWGATAMMLWRFRKTVLK